MSAALTVVGSINLDLTLRVERFPRPGRDDRQVALERACAEGARPTARMGAQWI